MSDVINLLPDSVANQIAAGEVIQRPASVVKELMENAIDAGATRIQVVIKGGGNDLIQVIDDGKGMSETDARMCFERHATSKIKEADDLFQLYSKGFRGEALASIASVAQVELRTRREEDELGTFIEIAGSRLFRQDSVQTDKGSNIAVKNLFFNVPARRRFLKSYSTEMMHIRNEFFRIVLVHQDISFSLYDDNNELFNLPESSIKARIETLFGNKMDKQLLPVEAETDFVSIRGFTGRPEFAQKSAHQYFFVNGRYMRHPYFHRAVMSAYEKLIKPGEYPSYFLRFEIDPKSVDVNVHPAKIEIKFENEQVVFSILQAAVKECLGKFQVMPALDFDLEGSPDIPVPDMNRPVVQPRVDFNPDYNPFGSSSSSRSSGGSRPASSGSSYDWEKLYAGFSQKEEENETVEIDFKGSGSGSVTTSPETGQGRIAEDFTGLFHYKQRYIITTVSDGLMMIDQHRAHFRVLYDRLMLLIQNQRGTSQQMLFPEVLELNENENAVMQKILPELEWVGFDIAESGRNSYSVNGVPSELKSSATLALLQELIAEVQEAGLQVKERVQERIAEVLARKSAVQYGQTLTSDEMSRLVDDLLSCSNHLYSPDGKTTVIVLQLEEIEKRFA